jgi:hypothetical protein
MGHGVKGYAKQRRARLNRFKLLKDRSEDEKEDAQSNAARVETQVHPGRIDSAVR